MGSSSWIDLFDSPRTQGVMASIGLGLALLTWVFADPPRSLKLAFVGVAALLIGLPLVAMATVGRAERSALSNAGEAALSASPTSRDESFDKALTLLRTKSEEERGQWAMWAWDHGSRRERELARELMGYGVVDLDDDPSDDASS